MSGLSSLISAGNGMNLLYLLIILPVVLGIACIVIPRNSYPLRALVFLIAAAANLVFALGVFFAPEFTVLIPWAGFGINLALRVYNFSALVILVVGCMSFLVALYSIAFLKKKDYSGRFFFYYLTTLALINGALLANNMVVMLFFWEGLMVVLFTMLVVKGNDAKTAIKAMVLNGIADLMLMLGVALTCLNAGTMMMDAIVDQPIEGLGIIGFVCMMAGAIGKAGGAPFHSWIPDAAKDAPLPFMAIMPAALEKILGLYLLVRIAVNFYDFQPGSSMSLLVMIIGAVTLLLGGAMALIQKDMKRLLSYHAISQVGYMILGIGTALPIGIVGGLFHLANNALYKSCLFMTAGSVENAIGTTDLHKFKGLGKLMPITGICFIMAALSISGVPPFNGFFSKELIFDAALESGKAFYIIAVIGAFCTAASFLKLGHAAFFGPVTLPENVKREDVHEAPAAMLIPSIVLAVLCLLFGLFNNIPVNALQSVLGEAGGSTSFAGWPHSMTLVLISVAVLLIAVVNHIIGYRATGDGLKAVDHIHYAPGLKQIYNGAEKHYFDPYDIFMGLVNIYAWLCFCIDRAINWIYDVLIVRIVNFCTTSLQNFNTGRLAGYMVWSFSGLAFLVLLFLLLI